MKVSSTARTGFTIIDLLIVVVTLALLASWVLMGMPRFWRRGGCRISCVSNLKQIGLSARMYANDNNEVFPSPVSERIRANDTNRLVRFALAMSNELNTPKVLICPDDKNRSKVADWARLTTTNISYFLALGAVAGKPDSLLGGDRNVSGGILLNPYFRVILTNTPAGWTEDIHQFNGNILLADGSAQQVNSNGLWKELRLNSNRVARLALP